LIIPVVKYRLPVSEKHKVTAHLIGGSFKPKAGCSFGLAAVINENVEHQHRVKALNCI